MRVYLHLILFLCLAMALPAQDHRPKQQKLDSLRDKLQKDSARIYRPRLAKPYLRVENRYSFFSRKPVNLFGFMAGATFLEKHIVCAGYYVFDPFSKKPIELVNENNIMTREYLSLNYFVFSYQYILFNRRWFQVQTPVETGYGVYSTLTHDHRNELLGEAEGHIIPISAGVQFIFKPIKWLGISTVGGYRHAVQEKNTNLNFTGFYYSFGVCVHARYLLRFGRYSLKKIKYKEEVKKLEESL